MSTSNQQTLADSGANERPSMLEKGNYIPWESRFRRFLDNKLEEGERMWRSIKKGPYVRLMIPNSDNTNEQILEPLYKMTDNKKQYIADVKVMNYLLQKIPNDIYNSVDASKEGESLEIMNETLTTCVNIMDGNNVRFISVSINTKFLNCLQPEWSKYVTMACHNQIGDTVTYDQLYDSLVQFEPHVQASKEKRAARNHDPNAWRQNRNQAFNAGYMNDESNQMVQRIPRTESNSRKASIQCYNYNEKVHYARDCPKPRVRDAKHFLEQMLLALKDEAESNLNDEENDFMLDNSYEDETL
uniref:CCHC-type domain-containing protein n=1 Tax=Tanacetum cinerariifolium TaxID=118510 RepID=A0A6L2NM92_TANCI|nr:hypothetical protein [Tanacetum cinerariifolium]